MTRSPRILVPAIAGLTLLALAMPAKVLLVWNATASVPIGLYLRLNCAMPQRGELALAQPPVLVRNLAARRGYLPLGVPLVKPIAALAKDRICALANQVTINGRPVAMRFAFDPRHRPLPAWHGCHTLTRSEVFLLASHVSNSFDGRYFGVVAQSALQGRLVALWLP